MASKIQRFGMTSVLHRTSYEHRNEFTTKVYKRWLEKPKSKKDGNNTHNRERYKRPLPYWKEEIYGVLDKTSNEKQILELTMYLVCNDMKRSMKEVT